MSILDKITGLRRDVEAAQKAISTNLAELRQRIKDKAAELVAATHALPPAEELIANAETLVDRAGAAWKRETGRTFLGVLAGRRAEPRMLALMESSTRGPRLPKEPAFLWRLGESLPFEVRCAFSPGAVKRELREGIAALMADYVGRVVASADRDKLLARLEQELRELGQAEERLVDEMNAAGITVEHRAEVKQRRETEAHTKALADRKAEKERERERALDARPVRPSAVASEYLKANAPRRTA